MVPAMTTLFCIFTLLVSLVLPAAALVFFAVKHKKQGILSAWLLGAAGFFVTQILIRVPILTVLQGQSWFQSLANNHLILYSFSLAFTAGLFELAGRFVVAKLLSKNLTANRALAAGMGHGGIEAMVLIGMTYVNNLLYIAMINTGAFDGILAQTAAMGVDTAQLELIRSQLISASPALFALAGIERILTMIAHVAMSMLVCYGVAHKKTWPCILACLALHTFIDFTAVVTMVLPQTTAYIIVYAILTVVAAASILIVRKLYRTWALNKEASL